MAEETRILTDLKDLVQAPPPEAVATEVQEPERRIDPLGRAYATGKRKNAVARVWLKPGSGRITVNGRESEVYFARPALRMIINQPLRLRAGSISTTSGARSAVAVCRGRRARCATASAVRSLTTSPTCAACSRAAAFLPAMRAWSSARSTASARRAAASSSPSDRRAPGPMRHRLAPAEILPLARPMFG